MVPLHLQHSETQVVPSIYRALMTVMRTVSGEIILRINFAEQGSGTNSLIPPDRISRFEINMPWIICKNQFVYIQMAPNGRRWRCNCSAASRNLKGSCISLLFQNPTTCLLPKKTTHLLGFPFLTSLGLFRPLESFPT